MNEDIEQRCIDCHCVIPRHASKLRCGKCWVKFCGGFGQTTRRQEMLVSEWQIDDLGMWRTITGV
jgi:hypothetical protein